MSKLLEQYRKKAVPALQKEFGIENIMAVPKLEKVVINIGIGRVAKEAKVVEKIEKDLAVLSGQKPVYKKAKKSISSFKVREGMNVGIAVTLRGKRMYDFIDRFINISLPRSKDFRGIDKNNFDKNGNLNVGLRESSIFPELNYENVKDIFSLQITFSTSGRDRDQGISLFKHMGFPIRS